MCILFIAVQQHPDYPLIICANRDEAYSRPTLPIQRWPKTHPEMIAGVDQLAGGSWLGVNQRGQFAAITNLRTGQTASDNARSRGELVTRFLQEDIANHHWLQRHAGDYNPFNLVYGDRHQLTCFNSHSRQSKQLEPGFHSVSNGAVDQLWPKMAKGNSELEKIMLADSSRANASEHDELVAAAFNLLTDTSEAPIELLPDTGVGLDWEKRLSPIFIKGESYGTRASAVLTFASSGKINFYEQTYYQHAKPGPRRHIQVTSETPA